MESLRIWAGERFRSLPRQLQTKCKQLNELRTRDNWSLNWNRIRQLEKEVENLATTEELYWRQHSRVNWLAHGDRNSKYFHACALSRRSKNHIKGLVSSHGD